MKTHRNFIVAASLLFLFGFTISTWLRQHPVATKTVSKAEEKGRVSEPFSGLETGGEILSAQPKPTIQQTDLAPAVAQAVDDVTAPATCPLTAAQIGKLNNLASLLERDDGSASLALEPLRDWAAVDPSACLQWVMNNLEGAEKSRCLDEVASIWASRTPSEALAWLEHQSNPAALAGSFAGAFAALTRSSPDNAAAWLNAHPDFGSLEYRQILVNTWGETDPPKAFDWAQKNLSPESKEAMLPVLLTVFQDEQSADSLFLGVSPQTRDNAIVVAVKTIADISPEYAVRLSGKIQDEVTGTETLRETLAHWQNRDQTAYQAWLSRQLRSVK
jgi:hypothetical protein